jgi:hypothetical protein
MEDLAKPTASFCEGCPFAGNFVGELKADNIRTVEVLSRRSTIQAIDVDGQATERVGVSEGVDFDEQQLRETLVRRVVDCTGTTAVTKTNKDTYSTQKCRAINHEVVAALIKKA